MKVSVSFPLFCFLLITGCSTLQGRNGALQRDVTPFDYGLSDARTGIDRYDVILKTHQAAIQRGVNVNYNGIEKLELEIPEKASRIPLTANNDFRGCEFIVTNKQKTVFLFECSEKSKPIKNISKREIDAGNFRMHPELCKGQYLLLINDDNPWVDNRKGYSYGHVRKDVLLVDNGIAQNKVVMPYDNDQSNPVCKYIDTRKTSITVKNLIVRRTEESSEICNVLFIKGKNNVKLSFIKIYTPSNELINDRAIQIEESTNVNLENVLIDGTYSQENHSGYGIRLNNVWNFHANHLLGKGNWGIFGNVNVNFAHIENSEINRFDIHCYGRDISFKNVYFSERYNQLSSVFGNVIFDKCTFTNFDPILNGSSYNAYVDYNLLFNDCVFNVLKKHNYLIKAGIIEDDINARKELEKKCWPNIYIRNLTVNMDNGVTDFVIVYAKIVGDISHIPINNISTIDIDGLNINASNDHIRLVLTPKSVRTANEINCRLKNVKANGKPIEQQPDVKVIANLRLKNNKIEYLNSKD